MSLLVVEAAVILKLGGLVDETLPLRVLEGEWLKVGLFE